VEKRTTRRLGGGRRVKLSRVRRDEGNGGLVLCGAGGAQEARG
jgi:hypothetical protein